MNYVSGVLLGAVSLLAVGAAWGGWFTVDQGERCALLRAGRLIEIAKPGLNTKVPFVDGVQCLEIRTLKLTFDKVNSYSRDIQQSDSKVAVNYRLPEANVERVFTTLGTAYAERILWPIVYQRYKEVFGRFTAAEIVADRQRMSDEIFKHIAEEALVHGVVVEAIAIENISFTKEFEHAIELAVKAKAEVTQAEQILLRKRIEAQTVVVQANAAAEAERSKAGGDADALKLRSAAEAEAYRLRGEMLARNPVLVEMVKAERWDGKLPVTMLPGSAVPFVSVR